jgi:predicted NBD/HSP70 family sugar kinase
MRRNPSVSTVNNPASSTHNGIILSFDLGGSHVAAMAARVRDPFNGAMTSVALDESGSATYLFDRFDEVGRLAISALNVSARLAGIAIAMPGPFDYSNGVSRLQHKFASWYGLNVRRHLAIRFGIDERDVLFLNDADAFLLGELQDSFAPKAVGITLGTGIGAAFAIDGRSVPATEILPNNCDLHLLPWKGSTVEEFISTRGIMRLQEERKGPYRSVKEIAASSSVDGIAADTMSAFGRELGLVIETYLLPFAPNAIFLGGSISRSQNTFLPSALSAVPVLSDLLKISSHFERAALIGSIADWLLERRESINR